MRFPLRDGIPSRTRPLVTWIGLALAATALLAGDPAPSTAGVILIHALPLLVLGETVEDQLGHARQLGLLLVAAGLGAGTGGAPLPAMTASVIGVHLSLFPTARIVFAPGVGVVEIPSFFLVGCWAFLLILTGGPFVAPVVAAVLSAGCARLLRQPDRSHWDHFDRAR